MKAHSYSNSPAEVTRRAEYANYGTDVHLSEFSDHIHGI